MGNMLLEKGRKIYDIWEEGLSKEEVLDARKDQLTVMFFKQD